MTCSNNFAGAFSNSVQQSLNTPFDITTPTGGSVTIYSSSGAIGGSGVVTNTVTTLALAVTVTFIRAGSNVFTLTVPSGSSSGYTVPHFDTITVSSTGAASGTLSLGVILNV
jgi:hypothetical protein